MEEFVGFPKIARLSRDMVITEKIDGTNACIRIDDQGNLFTGSRKRWISPSDDNYGFSKWAYQHRGELLELGEGTHYGEWWGKGIQRGYELDERRLSLFNVGKWDETNIPNCCSVVPILWKGMFDTVRINIVLHELELNGSVAAPGFMRPEGIVIFHTSSGILFKKTILCDEIPKGGIVKCPMSIAKKVGMTVAIGKT